MVAYSAGEWTTALNIGTLAKLQMPPVGPSVKSRQGIYTVVDSVVVGRFNAGATTAMAKAVHLLELSRRYLQVVRIIVVFDLQVACLVGEKIGLISAMHQV